MSLILFICVSLILLNFTTVSNGYDYSINQEGVIFLKFDKTSGNYFSYDATFSAYKLGSDGILFRGEHEPNREDSSKIESFNKKQNYDLTLDRLKQQIFVQKSKKIKNQESITEKLTTETRTSKKINFVISKSGFGY